MPQRERFSFSSSSQLLLYNINCQNKKDNEYLWLERPTRQAGGKWKPFKINGALNSNIKKLLERNGRVGSLRFGQTTGREWENCQIKSVKWSRDRPRRKSFKIQK